MKVKEDGMFQAEGTESVVLRRKKGVLSNWSMSSKGRGCPGQRIGGSSGQPVSVL